MSKRVAGLLSVVGILQLLVLGMAVAGVYGGPFADVFGKLLGPVGVAVLLFVLLMRQNGLVGSPRKPRSGNAGAEGPAELAPN